jgi:23S rRNA-/tRNA-specific pseudouridylate synthase
VALWAVAGDRQDPSVARAHGGVGGGISNDPFYPQLLNEEDDYQRPLKLLAQSLRFKDPLSGEER